MLTYLAVPYSHPDPVVRQKRFETINAAAAKLLNDGLLVYSPISMTHQMALDHALPTDFAFWQRHCLAFVKASTRMIVLKLDERTGATGSVEKLS